MASYNGNIDLLSLNGAQVFTGIDQKNPNRAFVCVPVDLNDIQVKPSRNDSTRQLATLRVNIWPLNEQYKAKIRQSAQERGDNSVSVPTHEMQISYSTEYIKGICKAFPKLVEQVIEANKQRSPEIATQDAQDENTHLFKLVRQRMNKRLAMLYQPQQTQQQPSPYPQQNFAQASSATAYVAPAEGTANDPFYGGMDDSDLPF